MDFNLCDSDGLRPIPIWSVNQGIQWASIRAPPSKIPPGIDIYLDDPPSYPLITDKDGVLLIHDYELYTAPYDPQRHWLGWIPTRALTVTEEDPVTFVFSAEHIPLEELFDACYAGGSDDGGSPKFIGFEISREWIDHTVPVSQRLHSIIMSLVLKTDLYGPNSWTSEIGDISEQVDDVALKLIQVRTTEARAATRHARRRILEQLAFVSWFGTVKPGWRDNLEELLYVNSLHLEDCPKHGYVVNLGRDYHKVNFPHWIANNVPFHYAWRAAKAQMGRFVHYSPEFSEEFENLVKAVPRGLEIHLQALLRYVEWEENILRYDALFQDLRVG
ncbi:hypothetical protein B0H17DRAFT_1206068 [Mycena rosella]|uniref:Uncharacterized protein n=1 Tax=Mycena rosella TaxID=1033263 RepID=A0AAD7GE77_MYCRO|nr:hypothetical protein B0H17DRAFT_1206068 [Mycena rosella]